MKVYKAFNDNWVDSDSADLILRNHLHPLSKPLQGNVYFMYGSGLDRHKVKLIKGCKRVIQIEKADIIVYPSCANYEKYISFCGLQDPTPRVMTRHYLDPFEKGQYLRLDFRNNLRVAASLFQQYPDKVIISDQTAILNFNNGLLIDEDNFDYFVDMLGSTDTNKTLVCKILSTMDLKNCDEWLRAVFLVSHMKDMWATNRFVGLRDMDLVRDILKVKAGYTGVRKETLVHPSILTNFGVSNLEIINFINNKYGH